MELERVTQFVKGSQTERLKIATKLAFDARRRVKEGDLSVFLFPLIVAIVKDGLADPLSDIPIAGIAIDLLLSLPIALYLFIFMWGRGKWKMRIWFFLISFLDLVPFIDLIPFTTMCVVYARHLAKKDADEARDELAKLDATMKGLSRKEQVALQRARLEEQQTREAVQGAQAQIDSPEPGADGGTLAMGSALATSFRPLPTSVTSPKAPMMDGMASVPAQPQISSTQMRGQAANDTQYDTPPRHQVRAVSGSDIRPDSAAKPLQASTPSPNFGTRSPLPSAIQAGGTSPSSVPASVSSGQTLAGDSPLIAVQSVSNSVATGNTGHIDLEKPWGAQNESYQFSKGYSQKWRNDTAKQIRTERKTGGSRVSQRDTVSNFYATQIGLAKEFQEDIVAGRRDIEQLSGKHQTLFLHGVPILIPHKDGTTELGRNTTMNNPLFESSKMSHLEKAGGVMAVQPTISVFTRKMGEKEPQHVEESFYPVGVILGRGQVLSAYGGDAGTITQGLRQRYSKYDHSLQSSVQGNIGEKMSMAIARKKDDPAAFGGTSEIVVEKPEVSGAYAYISPLKKQGNVTMSNGGGYDDYIEWETKNTLKNVKGTLEISEKYGVPAYLITHNGQALDLLDENLTPTDVASIIREKPVIVAHQRLEDAKMLMQYAQEEGVKKEIRQKIHEIETEDFPKEGNSEKTSHIVHRAGELLDLIDEKQASMDNGMWNFIEQQKESIDGSKEGFIARMREKGIKEGAINKAREIFASQQTVEECKSVLLKRMEKRKDIREKIVKILRENVEG